jgi:hypothetical protein
VRVLVIAPNSAGDLSMVIGTVHISASGVWFYV